MLDADVPLGAEAAADVGDLHGHLLILEPEHARQLVPHREGSLRGGVHGNGLVVHGGDGAVGLHGIVEQRREGEAVLDDVGGLAERLLGVALDEMGAAAVVAAVIVVEVVFALAIVAGVGVVHRGAALHRGLHLRHLGQRGVAHLDPRRRLHGRGLAVGHHDDHGLALEPHLFVCQRRPVLDRLPVRLEGADAPHAAEVEAVMRHDGAHAGDRARVLELETVDARVRVRTADDPGEFHPRKGEIRRVDCGSGDFFVGVQAADRLAYVFHRESSRIEVFLFYSRPAVFSEPAPWAVATEPTGPVHV